MLSMINDTGYFLTVHTNTYVFKCQVKSKSSRAIDGSDHVSLRHSPLPDPADLVYYWWCLLQFSGDGSFSFSADMTSALYNSYSNETSMTGIHKQQETGTFSSYLSLDMLTVRLW